MTEQNSEAVSIASRRKFIAGAAGAGALALAGCTSGDSGEGLSGELRISGSSTVFPVAQEVSRRFQSPDFAGNENVDFNLTRDGSSGGFNQFFIPGDSDMNNSSRPIGEDEVSQCRDTGFEPVEFFVAQDALTVVVNNDNDWVDEMSVETLAEIWGPESPPELWSDVDSSWPDEPFDLYGPADTSGTFDYFVERVIGETPGDQVIRDDFQGTEEDDEIAAGVSGNQYAFGYLPFAYYTNNPDTVKALNLFEDGGSPVAPSLEGAQSGNYPLARPLFFYANQSKLQGNDVMEEFIDYYIDQAAEDYIAEDIGYVPSSQDMVDANRENLEAAVEGEYEYEPIPLY